MVQEERLYRLICDSELAHARLTIGETDLMIILDKGVWCDTLERDLKNYLIFLRSSLQSYLASDHEFAATHDPFVCLPSAPLIARQMAEAAGLAHVGPMAAVAGAFAQAAGKFLEAYCTNVIVENGGDIYLSGISDKTVAVYAGDNPFSERIGVRISSDRLPAGVCSSSGKFGSSFSYGRADVAVVIADDALIADAAATATANLVHGRDDGQAACEFALDIPGVRGALVIYDDQLSACGELELVALS